MSLAQTIRKVLDRFPFDPPGELEPGHYVRISRNETHIYGHLKDILGPVIKVQRDDQSIEFLGGSAVKVSAGASAVLTTPIPFSSLRSDITFGAEDGLVIVGTRQTLRITNLDELFRTLAQAQIDWSVRNRIVIECQRVENATIICSNKSGNQIAVDYDAGKLVKVSAGGTNASNGFLHMPGMTGTIAFAAMRYIRFLNMPFGGGGPAYEARDLDPQDADAYDDFEDEGAR